MDELTEQQQRDLVSFVIEDFDIDLTRDEFNDAVLQLLEDVSGFEVIDDDVLIQLIDQLWSLYCDQH